jgi:SAM-dependent methyltransferase
VQHSRFGGTIKFAVLIATINASAWGAVSAEASKLLLKHIPALPPGKLTFGLSAYGLHANPRQLGRFALDLKKTVKTAGRPVRIVPNTGLVLNSAQVWHNRLAEDGGIELLLVADRGRTYMARTFSVQDVDNYGQRDFGRPRRDARVGMLPPKLAQIMLNLGGAQPGKTVLDPFCGTGVVLMEAALRDSSLIGTDLSPKMIDYTRTNLEWLAQTYHISPSIKELSAADATTYRWQHPINTVVTETYLGRPLVSLPDSRTLQTIISDCNSIIRAFLVNLHGQLTPGTRCCIAVPAWRTKNSFIHLPLLDDLKKIGYNQVSFSLATQYDLLYHRPDQTVARELLVLTR